MENLGDHCTAAARFCGIEQAQFVLRTNKPNCMSALHWLPPTCMEFADNFM